MCFAQDNPTATLVPTPMYFDLINDGVTLAPLELTYDLESEGGEALLMGPLRMDGRNFFADLIPASRLDSKLAPVLTKADSTELVFLFHWPEELIHEGTLEMISRTGRVVWSAEIDDKSKDRWREQSEPWRALLEKSGLSHEEALNRSFSKVVFGIRNVEKSDFPF